MPPDVIERAFDPFFTTKPTVEGTGLGLSMIYGFAKQSNGQVRIYSEVGHGTRVGIYLPKHLGKAEAPDFVPEREAIVPAEAGETVLVVGISWKTPVGRFSTRSAKACGKSARRSAPTG